MGFIHHFLVPYAKNNHRAKILHNSSLLILSVCVVLLSILTVRVSSTNPQVLGISYSINTQEMFVLVNNSRVQNNLPPLTLNQELSNAAFAKAQHMLSNNYWAHFAPDGTSPWVFIKNHGYNYQYAGENLAKGFTNSGDVVTAWLASPTHRDNIMSSKYNDIGFAIVEGTLDGEETVLVVQMFGSVPNTQTAQNIQQSEVGTSPEPVANNPEPQNLATDTQGESEDTQPIVELPKIEVAEPQILIAGDAVKSAPTLDAGFTTKSISFIILSVVLFAFVIDLLLTEKRKIPRIVGHNMDHIIIISLFIIFIILQRTGVIL